MGTWLAANWFTLIQTAGVVGGLFYSATALHLDAKVRRTEVILALTEAHRDIWEKLIDQPALGRVLEPNAALLKMPPSPAERRFVQLVLLHLDTVRTAAKEGTYQISPGMIDDVRAFLRLPIPNEVAIATLPYQSPDFEEFVKDLLS